MMKFVPDLDGYAGLWGRPFGWALSRVVSYAVVALGFAGGFLIWAAVYSLLQAEIRPDSDEKLPTPPVTTTEVPRAKKPPSTATTNGPLLSNLDRKLGVPAQTASHTRVSARLSDIPDLTLQPLTELQASRLRATIENVVNRSGTLADWGTIGSRTEANAVDGDVPVFLSSDLRFFEFGRIVGTITQPNSDPQVVIEFRDNRTEERIFKVADRAQLTWIRAMQNTAAPGSPTGEVKARIAGVIEESIFETIKASNESEVLPYLDNMVGDLE